jgi:hypothetical protein
LLRKLKPAFWVIAQSSTIAASPRQDALGTQNHLFSQLEIPL